MLLWLYTRTNLRWKKGEKSSKRLLLRCKRCTESPAHPSKPIIMADRSQTGAVRPQKIECLQQEKNNSTTGERWTAKIPPPPPYFSNSQHKGCCCWATKSSQIALRKSELELDILFLIPQKKNGTRIIMEWQNCNTPTPTESYHASQLSCQVYNFLATWAASRDLLSTRKPPSNVRETTRPCRSIYSYLRRRKRLPVAIGTRTITYAKSSVCWC